MKKMFLLLLVLISIGLARNNWQGYLDTSNIVLDSGDVFDSLVVHYGRVFNLTNGEDCRIVCMVNDTDATGFANDSVNGVWGYQTGCRVLNASNTIDTVWDDKMIVDTIASGSFGTDAMGITDSTGVLTRHYKQSDTSSVTGYAYQSRWVVPEWDEIWRPWFMGIGGIMNKQSALDLRFAFIRREGSITVK